MPCSKCSSSVRENRLAGHLRDVHGPKKTCSQCGAMLTAHTLKKHIRRQHGPPEVKKASKVKKPKRRQITIRSDTITSRPRQFESAPRTTETPKEVPCSQCGQLVRQDVMGSHLVWKCAGRSDTKALPPPGVTYVAHLQFELLPPGAWDPSHVIDYYRQRETATWLGNRQIDVQRIADLIKLNPSRCSVGKKMWLGYILFEFERSAAVALDCPITGNAIYVLSGNWREMLGHSKQTLLTRFANNTTRIIHKGEWQKRVKQTLRRGGRSKVGQRV